MENSLFIETLQSNFQLSENAIEHLKFRIKKIRPQKGSILHWPDEICKHIYFIETGVLRTFIITENGEETLDFAVAGNFSTLTYSFLNQQKTELGLSCEGNCVLFALSYYDLMALCDDMVEFLCVYNRVLQHYLLKLTAQQHHFRTANALQRLKYLLQEFPTLNVQFKHKHIASYLGVAPQSFTRMLKEYFSKC